MRKVSFVSVLVISFIQQLLYYDWDSSLFNSNTIFTLVGLESRFNYMLLAIWYLFQVSISFYFVGFFRTYIKDYGIYILVRSSSKHILIANRFIKLFQLVSIFSLFQVIINLCIIYFVGNRGSLTGNYIENFTGLVLYILTNIIIFMFQAICELWISEKIALVISNTYILVSVVLGGVILENGWKSLILYSLIPNLGMQCRLNLLHAHINKIELLIYYLLIIIIMYVVAIRKIRKMDIF